jgi:hypothetical protein
MDANDGLYAYGVVDKIPERLDIVGIDQRHKVSPVVKDDICVMVSEIDIDQFQNQVKNLIAELTKSAGDVPSGTGAILQAHEEVIVALMQDTTVVPLKFGTILQNEKAVLKMLQDQEEQFKRLLVKFAGKEEWGFKGYVDKQEYIKYVLQNEQKFTGFKYKIEKLSRGAAYLFRRKWEEEIDEYITDQFSEVTEEIFQDIGKDSFEAILNDILPQKVTGKTKEMILNAAYLVERNKVDHLFQRSTSFMKKYEFMGLELEFSGPWPPYNFT